VRGIAIALLSSAQAVWDLRLRLCFPAFVFFDNEGPFPTIDDDFITEFDVGDSFDDNVGTGSVVSIVVHPLSIQCFSVGN